MMKPGLEEPRAVKEHLTGVTPCPTLTVEERIEKRKRDKEFMRAMNEYVKKHGLLSDDPFFGGI